MPCTVMSSPKPKSWGNIRGIDVSRPGRLVGAPISGAAPSIMEER